jgi:hypothetical protein
VFVAVSSPLGDLAEHHLWSADRLTNKQLSAQAALALAERQLSLPRPMAAGQL